MPIITLKKQNEIFYLSEKGCTFIKTVFDWLILSIKGRNLSVFTQK